MTRRATPSLAQAAFSDIAQRGLSRVQFDAARAVALSVWHGHDEVSLKHLDGPCLGEAVSLVERLSWYNVVSQERRAQLSHQVRVA